MPTFPDDPDDKPAYQKPFLNAAPAKRPSLVKCSNFRTFSTSESDSLCERIKFVTDQIQERK